MLKPATRGSVWLLVLSVASAQQSLATHSSGAHRCRKLAKLGRYENTTIISSTYVVGNSTVQPWGTCSMGPVAVTAPLCRVRFSVKTSKASEANAEAWLPDEWYGRFLAIGNGGLGGCIDYTYLNYGSSFHFATFASNHGHDGDQGQSFYKQPEVLHDYTGRSVHAVSVVGKQIVKAYYSKPHMKSYFIGCSAGGRQGTYSALHWPEDFDGIIAAAPGTNFNIFLGSLGLLSVNTGAPEGNTSESFVPKTLWATVRAEIIKQCDGLDGVKDGVLDDPDACKVQFEALSCSNKAKADSDCLTEVQLEAVKKLLTGTWTRWRAALPRLLAGIRCYCHI